MTTARLVWALAVLGAAAPPLPAQALAPEGSSFHNGSSLLSEDDGSGEALVRRVEQALAVDDADEVARLMDALREPAGAALVRFGPRTHLPALDLAARRVAAADAPASRERVEGRARAILRRARRTRDLPALLDLATRGAALAPAREAALLAARLLFEQGRWWAAAAAARRAQGLPAALVLARAAEARMGVPSPPGLARSGRFEWAMAFTMGLDPDEDAGLPLVTDGRAQELIILDSTGLYGLDPWARLETLGRFTWEREVLAEERYLVSLPAPFRYVVARYGLRLLIPFNVPVAPRFRGKWVDRDARLLAVDLTPTEVRPSLSETLVTRPAGAEVAWSARAAPGTGASTAFGPPTVSGTRVFVQVFRTTVTTDVSLACFDARSGDLLFETPLARGAAVPRFASRQAETDRFQLDKRAREGPVAVRDGVVHACTGYGVVAAVDGLTGAVRHLFRYDRVFALEPFRYDRAFLFDSGGWNQEPVRLAPERVVVAPSDSRFLYMLSPSPGPRGHRILDDPIERQDRLDVVALLPDPRGRPSPAVLCSRRSAGRGGLVLLGPDGGTLEATPLLPEGETPTGRAVRVGRQVLLPTSAGVRRYRLDDLAAAPGRLPRPEDIDALPTAGVYAVDGGLVALTPLPSRGQILVQCWSEGR